MFLCVLFEKKTNNAQAAAQQISEKYPDGIDYLFNNAGASGAKNRYFILCISRICFFPLFVVSRAFLLTNILSK
jgi:hypothetical protein